jgi:SAM-dependent methyltransferase
LASRDDAVPATHDGQVRCVWCGGAATASHGRLARCARCGAATTYPAPDEGEIERAYAGWYRPAAGRFAAGGDRVLAFSRASLARRLDRIAPPGPVLDVGSGDGTLLRALRARGREAAGLERATEEPDVHARELVDFDERRGGWAAVVFWHALEHLREPGASLARAAELLAPGGVLIVAMPNLASWQSRLFAERWFHLDLPRHLVHLPAPALARGVEARGLEVERVSHWRGGQLVFGWLYGLVGMLPGHPDLYNAIRRPEARSEEFAGPRRALALAAAGALTPVAVLVACAEAAAGAGGTVYVEARRR